jgi:hypothetical protein
MYATLSLINQAMNMNEASPVADQWVNLALRRKRATGKTAKTRDGLALARRSAQDDKSAPTATSVLFVAPHGCGQSQAGRT